MDHDGRGLCALRALFTRDFDTHKLDRGFGRFALFLEEMLSGSKENVIQSLGNLIDAPRNAQEILARKISFVSICEHHLVPFSGEVRISYVPDSKICGYGGLFNVVSAFSRRLQLQERLTNDIGQFLYEQLAPKKIHVQIRARHLCTALKDGSTASILETKLTLGEDFSND